MKVYNSEDIRNVAVMGHSGSGKSNLIEAMLFTTGKAAKISKPTDAIKITSSLGLYTIEWGNYKYNVLDTPGYFDFEGEVLSALNAAYSAVITVDSTTGIQVGTDKALELTDEYNMPRFIFVNKIDSEKSDFESILKQLRDRYGKKIAPFHVPWGQGASFKGFINVVDIIAREYNGIECVDAPVPDNMRDEMNAVRDMLMESVAETSEELMEKYFDGQAFTDEEVHTGLRRGVIDGDIIPVLCGSTAKNIGIHTLLGMIGKYLPSPKDADIDTDSVFKGFVFKTVSDPFIGRISYVKIRQGSIKPETDIYNLSQGSKEKVPKLYSVNLDKLTEISGANAGDIVAFTKLVNASTSDTLSADEKEKPYDKIQFPNPQMLVAIEPVNKQDEDKISQGLLKLSEEDPSFSYKRNPETGQTVVGVQGDIHINAIKDKLKEKYSIDVKIKDLKIPYRETITGKSDVQGKHKKQSGGHGQYGDVKIRFEPSKEGFEFTEELFGGSVPKTYVPAVQKGLEESMIKGVLAGYPVTNIKAVLYDGSYHEVDSSEMAFKIAASIAFKKGMEEARPVLLEPVMSLEIIVPEENTGDIMGDISKKRGRVLGMESYKGGKQLIKAEAPEAEIFKYAIDLKAMTQGMGYFSMKFKDYEQVPQEIAEKIIEAKKSEKE